MPSLEARIQTDRASRYLIQLCRHAGAMGKPRSHTPRVHLGGMLQQAQVEVAAEWSDTAGTITFVPWGRCTADADIDTLTVRIHADSDDGLQRIQDVITRDFARFSQNELTISWHPIETPAP